MEGCSGWLPGHAGSIRAWGQGTAGQEPGTFQCLTEAGGPRIALDSGFRRNDECLDAVNRAPTSKTYPCERG